MADPSSASLKECLAEAKKALDGKDWKEAIRWCKGALKNDAKSYLAYVFVGKAAAEMGEAKQAEQAYSKACELKPDQTPAFQGLAELFAKAGEHAKSVPPLEALAKLTAGKDAAKHAEYSLRLAGALGAAGEGAKAREAFEKLAAGEDKAVAVQALAGLATLREKELSPEAACEDSELAALLKRLAEADAEGRGAHLARLARLALARFRLRPAEWPAAAAACRAASEAAPEDPWPLEAAVLAADEDGADPDSVADLVERLGSAFPAHPLASLSSANARLKEGKAAEAAAVLAAAAAAGGTAAQSGRLWLALSAAQLDAGAPVPSADAARKGIAAVRARAAPAEGAAAGPAPRLARASAELEAALAAALERLGSAEGLSKAATVLEAAAAREPGLPFLRAALAELEITKGDLPRAESIARAVLDSNPDPRTAGLARSAAGQAALALGRAAEAEALLREAAAAPLCPRGRARALCRLARALRARGEPVKPLLLEAARADPHSADAFAGLGDAYAQEAGGEARARKCFQRALELRPRHAEAGAGLCALLERAGEAETETAYLRELTERDPGAQWAWSRLGRSLLAGGEGAGAVRAFQQALRWSPSDADCWEGLSDAYRSEGRYTAAQRGYGKLLELDPSRHVARYHLACLHAMLFEFEPAEARFEELLQAQPGFLAGVHAYAGSLLARARRFLAEGDPHRAAGAARRAAKLAARALEIGGGSLACAHKLAGDARVLASDLPPAACAPEGGPAAWLASALESYLAAARLRPDDADAWRDAGLARRALERAGGPAPREAPSAVELVQRALRIDGAARHWAALGAVHGDPAVRQHCFVRALKDDPKCSDAWDGLGALYLAQGRADLARDAFANSLSLRPDGSAAWLGTAACAEATDGPDAAPLFGQSATFGQLPGAKLGAAYHLLHPPAAGVGIPITPEAAATVAWGHARKSAETSPRCAASQAAAGAALARLGLGPQAAEAFARARELLAAPSAAPALAAPFLRVLAGAPAAPEEAAAFAAAAAASLAECELRCGAGAPKELEAAARRALARAREPGEAPPAAGAALAACLALHSAGRPLDAASLAQAAAAALPEGSEEGAAMRRAAAGYRCLASGGGTPDSEAALGELLASDPSKAHARTLAGLLSLLGPADGVAKAAALLSEAAMPPSPSAPPQAWGPLFALLSGAPAADPRPLAALAAAHAQATVQLPVPLSRHAPRGVDAEDALDGPDEPADAEGGAAPPEALSPADSAAAPPPVPTLRGLPVPRGLDPTAVARVFLRLAALEPAGRESALGDARRAALRGARERPDERARWEVLAAVEEAAGEGPRLAAARRALRAH